MTDNSRDSLMIRKAEPGDVPDILKIYDDARRYMADNGNRSQWNKNYPSAVDIESDMRGGDLYVCTDGKDILAVFAFIRADDPCYSYIEDGSWLNDEPYGVVHRIAVADKAHGRGIGLYCLDYCFDRVDNLRIDTHRDNIPMQNVIKRAGFTYCGVVYMEDKSPRIAFMKTKHER